VKRKKTITRHDIVRAVNALNISQENMLKRIEMLEKNLGDYIEMKNDVKSLKSYRTKKKEGNLLWTIRLMKWLKGLLSGKAAQN
tara:strand:- start:9 stop:260 length:252 start_codon:yes stop_codon:yes gene_type:complete